ncbi:MAG: glycerol kinase GlpK, partial [Bdellovibrionales bacterium]|nr:glycerol kinase GlpK [Bdellovibrionales bacterium]
MKNYVLAIDQGTTSTRAAILNNNGDIIASHSQEFPQIYPQPGWVEHDPVAIWKTVELSVEQAIAQAHKNGHEVKNSISCIGITNQRETVAIWDRKTSDPIYNAIVWQCRRTAAFCLKHKKREQWIRKKTGLVLDPYFSATKISWILKNVKGALAKAKKSELAAGTMDSFLLWKLTGGEVHATDVTNASRTSLYNIFSNKWDADLLKFFSVPKALLPQVLPSSGVFGLTKGLHFLPDGIPISGIAGDQQSALFGQACFTKGEAKCTYGTGSFLLMNTGDKPVMSKHGMLTTIAWQLKDQKKVTYALEGSAFICGAAVQWLRDNMGFIEKSSQVEDMARKVDHTDGVEFVPSFTGLGAPYWDPEARAMISGLSRGSKREHIARACLEGMALQNVDLLKAMEKDLKKKMTTLKVDGGASGNDLLMQIQSDFLGRKVIRPKQVETTVLGAAF